MSVGGGLDAHRFSFCCSPLPAFPHDMMMTTMVVQIFEVKIGDAMEICSGNDGRPFVGRLETLDKEHGRYRVSAE